MKPLRTFLLIAFAAAMLGTLVDTGTKATAEHLPLESRELRVEGRGSGPGANREQLAVYFGNKAEIDAAWETLGGDASLGEALDAWLVVRGTQPQHTEPLAQTATPQPPSCRNGSCAAASYSGSRRSTLSSRHSDRRFGWRIRRLFGRR